MTARMTRMFVATLLLGACHRGIAHEPSRVDHATRRAELLSEDRAAEQKARAGDFVGALSGLMAPQGVLLAPLPDLERGPAAARATLERDTLNARSSARWTVLRHDVSADGRDGYSYGYLDVTRPSGEVLLGRYHAYWRRSDAGRWQVLALTRARRASGPTTTALPLSLDAHRYAFGPMRDTVAGLRELFDVEQSFSDSVTFGVGAAFGDFAAPDAGKAGASEYVFGPAAIENLFGDPPAGALGPAWTPEHGAIAASNDLGFTFGPAWPRRPGTVQEKPAVTGGRYFSIWRRQADGSWRYVVD